ncbi:sugar ABC transporter permease [Actinospica durhamensis]|uniref:Sugar ABC transporter permease n=1 Tax=Actinospica durhamensis TaxID=1508375 RepID=A0A941EXF2_9ACTN|nr:sugar ABC transporter permease [Actinospica durhamensis]MBR7839093.1 sugar ABC transporter permease [Actinospica durhamensis]
MISRLRHSFDRHWYAWAMALPVTLVLLVLVGYPLAMGVYYSFTNINDLNMGRTIGANHIPSSYHGVGLHNYWYVLSGGDGQFYSTLEWTLVWTLGCVVPTVGLGLGLAQLLNRRMRGRGVYRVLLILPWAVPSFVAAFSWRLILNSPDGLLDWVLVHLGLPAVNWLGDATSAKISVIMVNVWIGVPFMMVAFLGGLQAIPGELLEAAEVDGARPWQRFAHVTLPGLRPVAATVTLLGIIWTFNQFAIIYLVTGGGPGGSTDILITQAYNNAFSQTRDYAGASTYGVIILSMLLLFATFYRRAIGRGQEAAA